MTSMRTTLAALLCAIAAATTRSGAAEAPDGFGSNGVFTVGCWLKIDDPPGYPDDYTLLYRGESTGFRRVQFHLKLTDGRPEMLYTSPLGNTLGLRRAGTDWMGNDARRVLAKDLPAVPRGKWCHVAAVSGADGLLALYLDGRKWFAAPMGPSRPPACGLPVQVGVGQTWLGMPFHRFPGLIERVLLEPQALTPEAVAALVERERPQLDPKARRAIDRKPQDFAAKLPLTMRYETALPSPLPGRPNRVFKRETVAGQPRVTVNGVPVSGMAMMPSPYVKPEETAQSVRDFAAAGVRFYSDIFWSYGKLNDWWLGEGKYDFAKLDAKIEAALAAAPEGFYFPRVKLDPPDWWAKAHPEEMRPQHVKPDSAAWASLWPQMLADVVDHFELSPYAGRIMGYQVGAFVGSEWITRPEPMPAWQNDRPGDIAPSSAAMKPRAEWCATRGHVVAGIVKKAARIVKERTGDSKLTGVFFGYGIPEHAGFHELLTSPDVDYFCSPTTYHGRFAGEPGRFTVNCQASFRLNGKVYWDESDLRTHLYHKPSDWRHRDEFESVNAIKRAFGWSWSHGHETWWFCLEGNGLFHSSAMMETIARGREVCVETLNEGGASFADVAVFADPAFHIPNDALNVLVRQRFERWVLPRTGVAWDQYHMADIENPALPSYRLYVFLNAHAVTAGQRAAIKSVCRRKGATALFLGAAGYYNGENEGVAEMADLTGIAFSEHVFKERGPAPVNLADGGALPDLLLPRVFVPDDPDAQAFGTYRGVNVCAEKNLEAGRSVYMLAPPDERAFRAFCRRCGVHVWLDSDDTLGTGRGFVMVHAATDGLKTVRLPELMNAVEVFGADGAKKGVTSFTEYMRAGETRVWRLGRDD